MNIIVVFTVCPHHPAFNHSPLIKYGMILTMGTFTDTHTNTTMTTELHTPQSLDVQRTQQSPTIGMYRQESIPAQSIDGTSPKRRYLRL